MSRCVYRSLPEMKLARSRVEKPSLIYDDGIVPDSVASYARGRHYLIKTFGCQANVRDEEVLSGYLEKAGMAKAASEEEADLVIINTCAVRENAEEKVYGEIGKYKASHARDPEHFILAVCGCMMQEENMAKKVMASYPYVNLIFGTHNVPSILSLLAEHLERKKDLVNVISFPGDIIENLPSTRLDRYKAFVNISYGCDKFCTYCIVPYTRGRERSRPKEEILKECKELVEQGYQEITLLGQNVNSYGKDLGDGTSFATILEEVANLGIPRLRFMTSHPYDFSDEMIDAIARHENIMKCIHLPVQSGSTEVLRKMGRRYSREQYLDLVKRIRAKIPGVAITTDIIVGFPNETADQFEETLTLCEEVRYDAAFTFLYSPRRGTPAAAMKDDVTEQEKHERFDRLLKVIESGVISHSSQMVGETYRVLVDGPSKKDPSMLSGYTESSKLVNFKGPSFLKGTIVDVKILEDHAFSMIGELTEDPILLLARKLHCLIDETEEARRFLEAKSAYENDAAVQDLRLKIQEAERALVNAAAGNGGYEEAKKRYADLEKAYRGNPVCMNFESAHQDLEALLQSVQEALK